MITFNYRFVILLLLLFIFLPGCSKVYKNNALSRDTLSDPKLDSTDLLSINKRIGELVILIDQQAGASDIRNLGQSLQELYTLVEKKAPLLAENSVIVGNYLKSLKSSRFAQNPDTARYIRFAKQTLLDYEWQKKQRYKVDTIWNVWQLILSVTDSSQKNRLGDDWYDKMMELSAIDSAITATSIAFRSIEDSLHLRH